MEFAELKVERRSRTGKGGARECRRNGMLPGVLYGMKDEPTPVAVDPKLLDKALNTHAGSNVIIKLSLDDGGDPVDVVVKEVQVDNLRGVMKHVDFCHISLDRRIRSMVPFKILGESAGVKQGGILEHLLWELEVECLPLDIPDRIEIDVSELEIGDSVVVSQLTVPEKIDVTTDWNATVVHVVAPRVEEVVEEVVEEAEIEGEEPEVISAEAEKGVKEGEEKPEAAEEKKQGPQAKRKT